MLKRIVPTILLQKLNNFFFNKKVEITLQHTFIQKVFDKNAFIK